MYHKEDACQEKDAQHPIKRLTWLQNANEGKLKQRTAQKMQTTRCVHESTIIKSRRVFQMREEETKKWMIVRKKVSKTNRSAAQKILPTKALHSSRCDKEKTDGVHETNTSSQCALEDATVALTCLRVGQVILNKKRDTKKKDVLAGVEREGECALETSKKLNFVLELNLDDVISNDNSFSFKSSQHGMSKRKRHTLERKRTKAGLKRKAERKAEGGRDCKKKSPPSSPPSNKRAKKKHKKIQGEERWTNV
eukprot:5231852-Ditylum_brightwellii.AAC.1